MTKSMQDFARIGAAARLKELQTEMAEIKQMFPGLGSEVPVARRPGRPRRAEAASEPGAPVRKRRKLSASARKAISEAQKARWAKAKAEKKR